MSIGIIMLAHGHLHRAAEFASALARDGCKLVIHVDGKTPEDEYAPFAAAFSDNENVVFAPRVVCAWGAFSLTQASLTSAEILLRRWPEVRHVCQVSGACLPLRPVPELQRFLAQNEGTDFIESYSAEDSRWVQNGLSEERFTLYFPVSWRERRKWFDLFVAIQRRLGVRRKFPDGLVPHIGSQWWCLSRPTLAAILGDPARPRYSRFFRKCWIPDEGYFQTLVRKHSARIECNSLTFSRFDHQGKPHIFYDDHASLLAQSDRFFARKIWHGADQLYRNHLAPDRPVQSEPEFNPPALEERFREAKIRRNHGRKGLRMQSRFPCTGHEPQPETARPYAAFSGFERTYPDFRNWIANRCETTVHGRLFRSGPAEFSGGAPFSSGCLTAAPTIRDHRPEAFLANFIWNNRASHQSFVFEPGDGRTVGRFITRDPNAQIFMITGAWLLELASRGRCDDRELKTRAARHQMNELKFLDHLRWNRSRRVARIWTLGEALHSPYRILTEVFAGLEGNLKSAPLEMPRLRSVRDLDGFARRVRNLGIDLSSAGELGDGMVPRPQEESATVRTGG